jgi:PAS domain-containing protein
VKKPENRTFLRQPFYLENVLFTPPFLFLFHPRNTVAMTPRTVHVLKPEFLDSGHAEDAVLIAQKTTGPLTYNLVDFQYDDEPMPSSSFFSHSEEKSDAVYSIPEPGLLRKLLGTEALDGMKSRSPMETPEAHESAEHWLMRLRVAEQRYRFQNNVPDEDFVILLTTRGNEENFFVIPGLNGTRMAGVQINHYVMQSVPSHILVGYYLMALPVMLLAYGDLDLDAYLAQHAHFELRGCLNDLCGDNVNQLQLKTKTGDICMDCKKHFQAQNLNWDLVRQMRQGFELIRAIQLHLEDFLEGFSQPALTVGMKPKFDELGLTVPLSPKEMAVYVTFLEAGPEGIVLNALDEHREQLHDAYGRRYNRTDLEEIDRVVNRLINPLEPDLQQVITKINRKFTDVLGTERAEAYLISGPRGDAKSISLSRNLIRRA